MCSLSVLAELSRAEQATGQEIGALSTQALELISENQPSLVVLQVASNKSANTLNFFLPE